MGEVVTVSVAQCRVHCFVMTARVKNTIDPTMENKVDDDNDDPKGLLSITTTRQDDSFCSQ